MLLCTWRRFIPDWLERRFGEGLTNVKRLKYQKTIDAEARIEVERFRSIALVKRFPISGNAGDARCLRGERMVLFIFILKQLDLECEIVACQRQSYAAIEERISKTIERTAHQADRKGVAGRGESRPRYAVDVLKSMPVKGTSCA